MLFYLGFYMNIYRVVFSLIWIRFTTIGYKNSINWKCNNNASRRGGKNFIQNISKEYKTSDKFIEVFGKSWVFHHSYEYVKTLIKISRVDINFYKICFPRYIYFNIVSGRNKSYYYCKRSSYWKQDYNKFNFILNVISIRCGYTCEGDDEYSCSYLEYLSSTLTSTNKNIWANLNFGIYPLIGILNNILVINKINERRDVLNDDIVALEDYEIELAKKSKNIYCGSEGSDVQPADDLVSKLFFLEESAGNIKLDLDVDSSSSQALWGDLFNKFGGDIGQYYSTLKRNKDLSSLNIPRDRFYFLQRILNFLNYKKGASGALLEKKFLSNSIFTNRSNITSIKRYSIINLKFKQRTKDRLAYWSQKKIRELFNIDRFNILVVYQKINKRIKKFSKGKLTHTAKLIWISERQRLRVLLNIVNTGLLHNSSSIADFELPKHKLYKFFLFIFPANNICGESVEEFQYDAIDSYVNKTKMLE